VKQFRNVTRPTSYRQSVLSSYKCGLFNWRRCRRYVHYIL